MSDAQADYADSVVAAWSAVLPDVEASSVGFVVRLHQAMIAMEEFDRRSIGTLDLTAPEYMVLAVLATRPDQPGLTLRELQPLVMYSSGGMTHCVNRLARKELVERRPIPTTAARSWSVLPSAGANALGRRCGRGSTRSTGC